MSANNPNSSIDRIASRATRAAKVRIDVTSVYISETDDVFIAFTRSHHWSCSTPNSKSRTIFWNGNLVGMWSTDMQCMVN